MHAGTEKAHSSIALENAGRPYNGPGWYFFDECELPVGPYKTFDEAEAGRRTYCP